MTKAIPHILVLVLIVSLSACQNSPMVSVHQAPLRASSNPTLDEIGDMIEAVAMARGWTVESESPGDMKATLIRGGGKHAVDVSIYYDTSAFSITYEDSKNMNFRVRYDGKQQIHRRYNTWILWLKNDIQSRSRSM